TIDAKLGAGGVDCMLGHQAEGRGLAAGDRDEALHTVALRVVEHRVGSAHLPRVADVFSREKGARSSPNPQCASLAEAGHELLALVADLFDLVLRHFALVGV